MAIHLETLIESNAFLSSEAAMESTISLCSTAPASVQPSSLTSKAVNDLESPRIPRLGGNATLTVSDASQIYHIRHLDLEVLSKRSPTFAALFEDGPNGTSRLEIEERLSVANALVLYLYHGDYRDSADSAVIPYPLHLRMYDQAHIFGIEGLVELAFNCLREKAQHITHATLTPPAPAYVLDDLVDGLKVVYELRSEDHLIRPIKDELLQLTALSNGPLRLTENKRFQMLVIKIPSFYEDLYAMEGFILPQLHSTVTQPFESIILPSITDVYRWCPDVPKNDDSRPSTHHEDNGMDEPGFVDPPSADSGTSVETLEEIVNSHTKFDHHNPEDVAAMEAIILEERERALNHQGSRTPGKNWQIVHRPKAVLHFDDTDPEEGATSALDGLSTTESESEIENESDTEARQRHGVEPLGWDSTGAVEDMERTLVLRPSKRPLRSVPDAVDDGNEADDDDWTLLT
jgi:hypothetical protein